MAGVQIHPQWTTHCIPSILTCLLALGGANSVEAIEFAVVPVEGPNASTTEIHGINNAGQLVGTFQDSKGTHGLVCTPPGEAPCAPQFLTPLDLWFNGAKAVAVQAHNITTAGQIAGFFVDFMGESHGFLCTGFPANLTCQQVDITIDQVRMANTLILGIQAQGQFVGSYRDAQSRIHGFLFTDGNFIRIDVPSALATVVSGMATASGSATATIAGFFMDATFGLHGFLCQLPVSQHCFTTFDVTVNGVPQAMTQAVGINHDQIVGSFRDPGGNAHGFLCVLPVSAGCFTQLDAQNGTHTHILGLNDWGQIVGDYRDTSGRQHGFTAMVPSAFSAGRVP